MGSCSATVVDGGSKLNIVPDTCTVQVDCRLGPSETSVDAVDDIESCLARVVLESSGVSYKVSPAGLWVEPFALAAEGEFATLLLSALGQSSPGPIFPAVSDAPHLIAVGIPTAILGPGSLETAHFSSEFVDVGELGAAIDLYERVARAHLGRAGVPAGAPGNARQDGIHPGRLVD